MSFIYTLIDFIFEVWQFLVASFQFFYAWCLDSFLHLSAAPEGTAVATGHQPSTASYFWLTDNSLRLELKYPEPNPWRNDWILWSTYPYVTKYGNYIGGIASIKNWERWAYWAHAGLEQQAYLYAVQTHWPHFMDFKRDESNVWYYAIWTGVGSVFSFIVWQLEDSYADDGEYSDVCIVDPLGDPDDEEEGFDSNILNSEGIGLSRAFAFVTGDLEANALEHDTRAINILDDDSIDLYDDDGHWKDQPLSLISEEDRYWKDPYAKPDDYDPETIDVIDVQDDLLEDQDFMDDLTTWFPDNAHVDDHTVALEGAVGGAEEYLWALEELEKASLTNQWYCLTETDSHDDFKTVPFPSGSNEFYATDMERAKKFNSPIRPFYLHAPFAHHVYSTPEAMDWMLKERRDYLLASQENTLPSELFDELDNHQLNEDEEYDDYDWEDEDDLDEDDTLEYEEDPDGGEIAYYDFPR